MEANPDYFRGAPKIKRIVLTAVPTRTRASRCWRRARSTPPASSPSSPAACARTAPTTCSRSARRTRARSRCRRVTRCCATRRSGARCRSRSTASSWSRARWTARASPPTARSCRATGPTPGRRDAVRPGRGRAPARRRGLQARGRRRRAKGGQTLEFTVMYPAADSVRKDIALALAADMAKVGVERQARGPDVRRHQEAPGQGRDGVRLRHAVRPRPRALLAVSLEVRQRRRRRVHQLPAHPRRRDRRALDRERSTLDAADAQAGVRHLQAEHAQGRELAVARAPAPRRGDLQARQRRRPAGRAARARLLARDVVEPGGLDAGAGAMRRLDRAAARAAAADPARGGRGDVRARRGLALRPDRRLRRRRDAGQPGAPAEIAQAWGFDQALPERFGHWTGQLRPRRPRELDRRRRPARRRRDRWRAPRARSRSSAARWCWCWSAAWSSASLAAALRGTVVDWVIRTLSYFSTAAPSFWVGLLALYVFSIELGWLPAGGPSDPRSADPGGVDLAHLILPMAVLALTQYAWFTLFVRNTVLEVLREDHVQFARAQGIGELAVLLRHALPSALIPFVTLAGRQPRRARRRDDPDREHLRLARARAARARRRARRGHPDDRRHHARRVGARRGRQPAGRHRLPGARPARARGDA